MNINLYSLKAAVFITFNTVISILSFQDNSGVNIPVSYSRINGRVPRSSAQEAVQIIFR